MKAEINFAGAASRKSAAHQPEQPDAEGNRDEPQKTQLFRRNAGQKPRHLDKKTRGQCIDQPLDDQEEGKTCEQIRHVARQFPVAGAAGAVVGGTPSAFLKKRKNSESGERTMVVPLSLSAPV